MLGCEGGVLVLNHVLLIFMQEVNGKEVQISLTGFMEKHTAKFMKELWTLLLSAQKNASGVPQQFLDAKEEEARKKKVLPTPPRPPAGGIGTVHMPSLFSNKFIVSHCSWRQIG